MERFALVRNGKVENIIAVDANTDESFWTAMREQYDEVRPATTDDAIEPVEAESPLTEDELRAVRALLGE